MRKIIITIIVTAACLAVPAMASAQSEPSWCGGGRHGNCANAETDLQYKLEARFGNTWNRGTPWMVSCPWEASNGADTVYCMADFQYRGTWRFIQGSVNSGQDANDTASLQSVTTWRRYWRSCSHQGGESLSSNAPCNAPPVSASYIVNVEMGGTTGHVGFEHLVGWQFMDSGPFSESGMNRVALYTCAWRSPSITCTDAVGDSFNYTY